MGYPHICTGEHGYRRSNNLCRPSNHGIHRCTNHHHAFNIFANCTLHAHLCTCLYTCLNTCPCPCPRSCREEACYEEEGQEKRMLQVSEHHVLCGRWDYKLLLLKLMSSTSGAKVSQSLFS